MLLVKERESEQKLLIQYLKEKNTILIKGVPGSGKTYTVLKTLEILEINNYEYYNCAYKQPKLKDIKSDLIIIDEVDMLKNKLILYSLMNSKSLIIISNTLTLSTKLSSRITKIINFLPYTSSQMVKILGRDTLNIRRIVTGDIRRATRNETTMDVYEPNEFQKCKSFDEYASLCRIKGIEILDFYEFLDGRDTIKDLELEN